MSTGTDEPTTTPEPATDAVDAADAAPTFVADTTLDTDTFVEAFYRFDVDYFDAVFADDVQWRNSGLPTLSGHDRVLGALRQTYRYMPGFRVNRGEHDRVGDEIHINRVDHLPIAGPFAIDIMVYGTFTIVDGKVSVWSDRFSARDTLGAVALGIGRGVRALLPFG